MDRKLQRRAATPAVLTSRNCGAAVEEDYPGVVYPGTPALSTPAPQRRLPRRLGVNYPGPRVEVGAAAF